MRNFITLITFITVVGFLVLASCKKSMKYDIGQEFTAAAEAGAECQSFKIVNRKEFEGKKLYIIEQTETGFQFVDDEAGVDAHSALCK